MNEELFFKLVGNKVRKLRKVKGFNSYEDFAFTFDIPRHNVQRLEAGKPVTMITFIRILNALEITPEQFFKGIK